MHALHHDLYGQCVSLCACLSAKGGIVIAIHSELGVPVKLVGLGEGINDLVDFDATEFVDALFE